MWRLKLVSFETCVIWNMWHVRTEGIYLLFFLLLWAFNTMFFQTHVVWSRNNNSRINTWKYRNSKDDNYLIWRQFWSYFTFKEWTDLFDPKNINSGSFYLWGDENWLVDLRTSLLELRTQLLNAFLVHKICDNQPSFKPSIWCFQSLTSN